jgi:hypothetical protein
MTTPAPMSTADLAGMNRPAPVPPEPRDGGMPGKHMTDNKPVQLMSNEDNTRFRNRWGEIQTSFVDEPRSAVEKADGLVAETMKHLAEVFANERANLEKHWNQGEEVSTEDLRLTLQRYRSFFDRLLSL